MIHYNPVVTIKEILRVRKDFSKIQYILLSPEPLLKQTFKNQS